MKKLSQLMVLVMFALCVTSCAQQSKSAQKMKGFVVVFAETGDTLFNAPKDSVEKLIANPPEDMIIYHNGKIINTIVE